MRNNNALSPSSALLHSHRSPPIARPPNPDSLLRSSPLPPSGKATDLALGWGVAVGAPFLFQTTLRDEYKSDIYGERGILLGAVHAIVEGLYRRYQRQGMTPEDAFLNSAESITGQITKKISTRGIKAVYDDMNADDKKVFETAYSASYSPSKEILQECYDEVACGNEIRSVIMQNERVNSGKGLIGKIDGTNTWQVGEKVRASRDDDKVRSKQGKKR